MKLTEKTVRRKRGWIHHISFHNRRQIDKLLFLCRLGFNRLVINRVVANFTDFVSNRVIQESNESKSAVSRLWIVSLQHNVLNFSKLGHEICFQVFNGSFLRNTSNKQLLVDVVDRSCRRNVLDCLLRVNLENNWKYTKRSPSFRPKSVVWQPTLCQYILDRKTSQSQIREKAWSWYLK